MRVSTDVLTAALVPLQVSTIKPIPAMQPIIPASPEAVSVAASLESPLAESIETSSPSKSLPSARNSRRVRKQQAKLAKSIAEGADSLATNAYRECLEQAEICREQARAAARLKRFKAARGLFATAISLCQRALGLKTNGPAPAAGQTDEAQEYLRQLTMEMSTYSELAKSMERPLCSKATPSIHDAAVAALAAMPVASTSSSFSNPSLAAPSLAAPRTKPGGF